MLVFQPLQSGGRDVVLERRPAGSGRGPRSGRFSRICQSVMDFVYLRMTQSRKFRASVPIILRTVNVTHAG